MILAALLLLPVHPVQDDKTAELDPMKALARLTEGVWRADAEGAAQSYQAYDWRAGRRSIRSCTVFGPGESARVIGEGFWFHDPARGAYRVLGFAAWGRVDGELTIEGETWHQDYRLYRGRREQHLRDDWHWTSAAGGHYMPVPVQAEDPRPSESAAFVRAPRPQHRPPVQVNTKQRPGPLEPLAMLVGGEWELDTTWPDGTRFHVRDQHSWGVNKLCLWKRTWRIAADGTRAPVVDGVYFADPTSGVVRFVTVADYGTVYEGTVTREGDTLTFEYSSNGDGPAASFREVQLFTDQSMTTTLWQLEDEGEVQLYADTPYRRVKAPEEK